MTIVEFKTWFKNYTEEEFKLNRWLTPYHVCIIEEKLVTVDDGWIDVKERLPIHKECVLFRLKTGEDRLGFYASDEKEPWKCDGNGYDDYLPCWKCYAHAEVTHWMPIPELPK